MEAGWLYGVAFAGEEDFRWQEAEGSAGLVECFAGEYCARTVGEGVGGARRESQDVDDDGDVGCYRDGNEMDFERHGSGLSTECGGALE